MERIPVPIVRADQIQPFAAEQVAAILRAAARSRHRRRDVALVLMLFDTALRASEICQSPYLQNEDTQNADAQREAMQDERDTAEHNVVEHGAAKRGAVERDVVYQMLTDRPDNRRPLTRERNHVDILLMEGKPFICPWTHRAIRHGVYAIDHLMPVSVYPINELCNLVPADPHFNSHVKSNRLPSPDRLAQAKPHLALAYLN